MKNVVMGIVAHVDAGKTTLSEALLYSSGATDRLGRVDRRDAHLDNEEQERERGITIFSKQALFDTGDTHVTLIDTPGHVDFACETERALAIQDYAILIISATDGVRAHTKTLWQMLSARRIPTFIFVNKTDLCDRRQSELLAELTTTLCPYCVDFTKVGTDEFYESAASADERLMEEYFEGGALSRDSIRDAVRRRKIFPCYFGSALKLKGVNDLLRGIDEYTLPTEYSKTLFGARVFKIMRDKNGRRITFAKITGGSLKPKDTLQILTRDGLVSEKVEEIRVFSANKSKPEREARPGTVCALYGLNSTRAGMGLGIDGGDVATLTPPLSYGIILPPDANPYETYAKLSYLAEEDPSLGISFDAERSTIRVNLMGEVQLEVFAGLVKERLGLDVTFDEGSVLYRETVKEAVVGSGHFEPLCHYAEVHLEISPLPEGSGVQADSDCDRESLALNWQRLIMTHVDEKVHRGKLIGAPLTDVRISIIGGRAHQKHTEGGDFREATYRAVRQGIMKSDSMILEPTFDFRAELPAANLGRLLTDINNMHGTVTNTETDGVTALAEGNCPVATIRSYPTALRAYTKGFGRIALTPGPYVPCHNEAEVIERFAYDPELDQNNPASSVFCKGGAGYSVSWYEADEKMHVKLDTGWEEAEQDAIPERARSVNYRGTVEEDKELMRIFEATYGKIKRREAPEKKVNQASAEPKRKAKAPPKKSDEYILIDGYNVIHAWEHLKKCADIDFSLARDTLIRAMCSFSSFKKCKVIVVFDAYRVKDGVGSVEKCGNTTVIYTKEKETADEYIEKATYEIAPTNYVRVVTSDLEEQYIILGNGALRVSPREFLEEVDGVCDEINAMLVKK